MSVKIGDKKNICRYCPGRFKLEMGDYQKHPSCIAMQQILLLIMIGVKDFMFML